MKKDDKISRRAALTGMGAGLAVAAVSPVFGANGYSIPAIDRNLPLEDPTSKYPKPPFKKQLQPWPGLASKMEPVPDHGEKSYKISSRLMGRKALITGADFGMVRACTLALSHRRCRCGHHLYLHSVIS